MAVGFLGAAPSNLNTAGWPIQILLVYSGPDNGVEVSV